MKANVNMNHRFGSPFEVGRFCGRDEAEEIDRHKGILHKPEDTLDVVNGHRLVVTFTGNCYDVFGSERTYLFRFSSEQSAIARWRGYLRSIGVEA